MNFNLIGLDYATDDKKVGLAFGRLTDDRLSIYETVECGRNARAVELVASRLVGGTTKTLLAIDAPLGWPRPLGRSLVEHTAGQTIETPANEMFRRETDRHIYERLRKMPLDVGADRIARTAHAALRFLGELRAAMAMPVPLAWTPDFPSDVAAIEVYPAATLTAHGIRAGGYKKKENVGERLEILDNLSRLADLECDRSRMESNSDTLDAAVCLLAAFDFLTGSAIGPGDSERAFAEGWIWTRNRRN